jgi:tRNA threonylcarbamoyl adenosine modification protein YeaZ
MPFLLALDTSTPRGSLAFVDTATRGVSLVEHWEARRHAGALNVILARHAARLAETERVAVGLGPGGFTGIRVAIAAAQALRLARGCRLTGVCSADAVAAGLPHVTRLGVFSDAKRGERYLTIYARGVRVRGPLTLPLSQVEEEVGKLTLAVSAEPLEHIPERAHPEAAHIAHLAFETPLDDLSPLEPFYLRTPTLAPAV